MKLKKSEYYNYFVLYLLIATTAIPFFFDSQIFSITGFCISGLVFFNRGFKIEMSFILVCALFFCMEVFQYLNYNVFIFETFASIFIKLSFSYFVVRILGLNFYSYYVNLIKLICLISLFFYLIILVPGVFDFLFYDVSPLFKAPFRRVNEFYAEVKTVILYTLDPELLSTLRNPGPFWEPGIFSIFILLAIMFNIIRYNQLLNKTNIILSITLFTTLSTTGILGFFLILFSYYLINSKSPYKAFHVLIIIFVSMFLFFKLPFLSEKVKQNIELTDYTGSRFGSLMADWKLFKESPFIGWGRGKMRFGEGRELFFSQESHRNNGISALLTQYGIFFSIIYFLLYYISFKTICKMYNNNLRFAVFCVFIIMFVGFSQTIFTRQFFLSFLFLGLILDNKFKVRNNVRA